MKYPANMSPSWCSADIHARSGWDWHTAANRTERCLYSSSNVWDPSDVEPSIAISSVPSREPAGQGREPVLAAVLRVLDGLRQVVVQVTDDVPQRRLDPGRVQVGHSR